MKLNKDVTSQQDLSVRFLESARMMKKLQTDHQELVQKVYLNGDENARVIITVNQKAEALGRLLQDQIKLTEKHSNQLSDIQEKHENLASNLKQKADSVTTQSIQIQLEKINSVLSQGMHNDIIQDVQNKIAETKNLVHKLEQEIDRLTRNFS